LVSRRIFNHLKKSNSSYVTKLTGLGILIEVGRFRGAYGIVCIKDTGQIAD